MDNPQSHRRSASSPNGAPANVSDPAEAAVAPGGAGEPQPVAAPEVRHVPDPEGDLARSPSSYGHRIPAGNGDWIDEATQELSSRSLVAAHQALPEIGAPRAPEFDWRVPAVTGLVVLLLMGVFGAGLILGRSLIPVSGSAGGRLPEPLVPLSAAPAPPVGVPRLDSPQAQYASVETPTGLPQSPTPEQDSTTPLRTQVSERSGEGRTTRRRSQRRSRTLRTRKQRRMAAERKQRRMAERKTRRVVAQSKPERSRRNSTNASKRRIRRVVAARTRRRAPRGSSGPVWDGYDQRALGVMDRLQDAYRDWQRRGGPP